LAGPAAVDARVLSRFAVPVLVAPPVVVDELADVAESVPGEATLPELVSVPTPAPVTDGVGAAVSVAARSRSPPDEHADTRSVAASAHPLHFTFGAGRSVADVLRSMEDTVAPAAPRWRLLGGSSW
jgi:hypothetical protein